MPLKIKIEYHYEGMEPIKKIKGGDWIDLRAAKDYTIQSGEFTLIDLGVSMELPIGYEAHIAPRSSTFKKWGLLQTNSIGVIDHSYCGDDDVWMMPVYATRMTQIHKGDRICQFRIVKNMEPIIFEEVNELNNKNRDGFGSTGVN